MLEISQSSIICAVKTESQLKTALMSKSKYIFLLKANINTVLEEVKICHEHGKKVFIHIDLAEGFGKDEATISYLAKKIRPDGIISTKANIVKMCKDKGIFVVYRVFLIDGQSQNSAISNIKKLQPNSVEVMPGIAYEGLSDIKKECNTSLIAGGLITFSDQIEKALTAGAVAVSTSNAKLWK